MSVAKVDGFGVRSIGSGYNANLERRVRDVRMVAGEALAKGDAVCFDFSGGSTEPDYGWGNRVMKANGDVLLTSQSIGVAAEDISSGSIGTIRVGGFCDFAKIDGSAAAPGQLLIGGNANDATTGLLVPIDTSAAQGSGGEGDQLPVAIHIYDDGNDEADGKVFLLNPANL